jgi:branched-chain amino acid transport system ATP-binding protein
LEVRDLRVSYGQVEAVRGVSLSVAAGQLVTLIGPNGAGKTSILAALCGLVPPCGGGVFLDGRALTGQPSHAVVAAGLALVPEGRAILGRMTIEENLILGGELSQAPAALRAAIEQQYARFPILGARRQQPAGSLSGGQMQMLAFARALLARPRVLLLDEPSMGLSPILVKQVFETIAEIHRAGTTVLLVEQNARLALSVADHAYVLERGQVVLHGAPAALRDDERIKAVYLGG